MNRLNNALKQRDAAREESLLQGEKLSKLQVLACHGHLHQLHLGPSTCLLLYTSMLRAPATPCLIHLLVGSYMTTQQGLKQPTAFRSMHIQVVSCTFRKLLMLHTASSGFLLQRRSQQAAVIRQSVHSNQYSFM